MNAATVVEAVVSSPDSMETLRRELSQLHILLLGARADAEDLLGPAPCRTAAADLKKGIKQAVVCLDAIRARIEAG